MATVMRKSRKYIGKPGRNAIAAALHSPRYGQRRVEMKTRYRRKLKHKGQQTELHEGRP